MTDAERFYWLEQFLWFAADGYSQLSRYETCYGKATVSGTRRGGGGLYIAMGDRDGGLDPVQANLSWGGTLQEAIDAMLVDIGHLLRLYDEEWPKQLVRVDTTGSPWHIIMPPKGSDVQVDPYGVPYCSGDQRTVCGRLIPTAMLMTEKPAPEFLSPWMDDADQYCHDCLRVCERPASATLEREA